MVRRELIISQVARAMSAHACLQKLKLQQLQGEAFFDTFVCCTCTSASNLIQIVLGILGLFCLPFYLAMRALCLALFISGRLYVLAFSSSSFTLTRVIIPNEK